MVRFRLGFNFPTNYIKCKLKLFQYIFKQFYIYLAEIHPKVSIFLAIISWIHRATKNVDYVVMYNGLVTVSRLLHAGSKLKKKIVGIQIVITSTTYVYKLSGRIIRIPETKNIFRNRCFIRGPGSQTPWPRVNISVEACGSFRYELWPPIAISPWFVET